MASKQPIPSSSDTLSRSVSAPPTSLTTSVLFNNSSSGGNDGDVNQELMDRYVRAALARDHHREPAAYAFVLGQLRNPQRPHIVAEWLRALGTCASLLTLENAREFLVAIFKLDFTADPRLQTAFLSLVTDIATCNSTYIPQMMRNLMVNFNPRRLTNANQTSTPKPDSSMLTEERRQQLLREQEEQASAALSTLGYDLEKSRVVRSGVVNAIQEILRLVPLASTCVWQTFRATYPHKSRDVVVHEAWIDAAFDICKFAPSIREPIISTVLSRILDLDVELRVDEDEGPTGDSGASAAAEDDSGILFQLELDSRASTPQPGQLPPILSPALPEGSSDQANKALATKLDRLMVRLFTHLEERLSSKNPSSTPKEDFNILLRHFVHNVLYVYSCKTTQFAIFYACKFDPSFAESFLSTLMRVAWDQSITPDDVNAGIGTMTPLINRVSACAYVASFLARANFISLEITQKYMIELINLAKSYTREFEASLPKVDTETQPAVDDHPNKSLVKKEELHRSSSLPSFDHELSVSPQRPNAGEVGRARSPAPNSSVGTHTLVIDPNVHQLFYAAIQAAMYVFCYTSEKLIDAAVKRGEEPNEWIRSLGFESVLSSPLSPLTMCNAAVVEEFRDTWKRISTNYDALKLPSILVHSQFSVITTRGITLSGKQNGLNTFKALFPFDPYLLKDSSSFIDPIYSSWSAGDDESENDEEEDEDEDEDDMMDHKDSDLLLPDGREHDDEDDDDSSDIPKASIKIDSMRADDDDDEASGSTSMSFGPISAARLQRPEPRRVPTFRNFNFTTD